FTKIDNKLTNKEKGQIIRNELKKYKKIKVNDCWLCSGLSNETKHFANIILKSLKKYDYETFLIGSKIDEEILEKEQILLKYVNSEFSESIKNELNREIGKILEKKLKKEVNFENPTIMAVIDTAFDSVSLQISSLYIYGRYKKFKRNFPQTKWFCKICKGKGCKKCHYTGKLYDTSVEELIAYKFLKETNAVDESFHGCGREDIDVRMLGNGRPFVLEIKNPVKRKLNLAQLEKEINMENKDFIEVKNLRFSSKDEINRLKQAEFNKIYKIVICGEKPINNEKLKKAVLALQGKKIGQFTPSRVAHRRANMVRKKYIFNCKIKHVDGNMAILIVEAQSGTYIKELITGDEGRTKPNLSEMIDNPCKVIELDVIEIKGE
ncbi:MAG: tRNA pseudouridine(54/55) synthase Pus10, partial [Candidatus Thermoplasmatota archaeon]|nr:tRNA pseudouridine(54/55) synthase Pus10 [Candidatus Thermoplasmatota archaeon]